MALELPKLELKGKKKKPEGQKNDFVLKVMEFFDKNPFMKILVPVIILIIVVAIVAFLIFGDGVLFDKNSSEGDNTTPTNEVSVLPGSNIIHDKNVVELINSDPMSEDILASATYKGFVKGTSGLKTALIEIGTTGDTLILTVGETVGDSSWELIELNSDYVIFKAGDITKKIVAK